jgi:hypothetical protein
MNNFVTTKSNLKRYIITQPKPYKISPHSQYYSTIEGAELYIIAIRDRLSYMKSYTMYKDKVLKLEADLQDTYSWTIERV